MDIKVGEYIRTKQGEITKIVDTNMFDKTIYKDIQGAKYYLEDIVKHSPNIIDLIEVGDYVNGHKIVSEIWSEDDNDLYFEIEGGFGKASCIGEKSIKSIVTKEQFKNVMYEE